VRSDGTQRWRGREGLAELAALVEAWARADERILAMAAFGSMARTDRQADDWSDLDVLLVVDDSAPWHADLRWIDAIAPTWTRFVHPSPIPGAPVHQVLFDGGYDADLVVVDPSTIRAILDDPAAATAVFGHGVRVVFDGPGVLAGLADIVPQVEVGPPTAADFALVVGQLRFQLVWATKRLRRGELWRTVDDLDGYLAHRLLILLEWAAIGEGRTGVFPDGRRLEQWASAQEIDAIRRSRAAYDPDEAARAILGTHDVAEALAARVAAAYDIPLAPMADLRPWIETRLSGR
jgi:aminoglycoside 6-adenylyltransferase